MDRLVKLIVGSMRWALGMNYLCRKWWMCGQSIIHIVCLFASSTERIRFGFGTHLPMAMCLQLVRFLWPPFEFRACISGSGLVFGFSDRFVTFSKEQMESWGWSARTTIRPRDREKRTWIKTKRSNKLRNQFIKRIKKLKLITEYIFTTFALASTKKKISSLSSAPLYPLWIVKLKY